MWTFGGHLEALGPRSPRGGPGWYGVVNWNSLLDAAYCLLRRFRQDPPRGRFSSDSTGIALFESHPVLRRLNRKSRRMLTSCSQNYSLICFYDTHNAYIEKKNDFRITGMIVRFPINVSESTRYEHIGNAVRPN
ncbi:hypothetical protein CEXT_488041 [Caerostris extrusa]|uniref:Uncharacterized protein n=1 Tax=Caerostris extrusa TaxID=172846 RepID=A0AAV4PRL6_CAEEX|nr:hypothetical protein CEXT_488041 [Caerostris extrusa]